MMVHVLVGLALVFFAFSNTFLCAGVRIEYIKGDGCGSIKCSAEYRKLNVPVRNIGDMRLAVYFVNGYFVELTKRVGFRSNPMFQVPIPMDCRMYIYVCAVTYMRDGEIYQKRRMFSEHIADNHPTSLLVIGLLAALNRGIYAVNKIMQDVLHTHITVTGETESEMASEMMKVMKPKECTRGMPAYSPRTVVELDGQDYLCDTESDGGGWILLQRRADGKVDFDRRWIDYQYGFGNLDTDFWIGLEPVHQFTTKDHYEFRIDAWYRGGHYYAHYKTFKVLDSASNYKLSLGKYLGGYSNTMRLERFDKHFDYDGMNFTTKDKDLDNHKKINCAAERRGGFWYNNCGLFYPNAKWGANYNGVTWGLLTTFINNLDIVELKFRRRAPTREYNETSGKVETKWD